MEYRRFHTIQANFKLCNNKTNKADKIYKVRDYTDYLTKKREENFYPGRCISVDESIIPYNRQHPGITVYIKNKPINKGFLLYDIADPRNGYLLKAELYTGRENRNNKGLVMIRTLRLLEKYLDKGHIVFGDNFYTSIELVQNLTKRNTGYVGTLRFNRDKSNGLDDGMKKGDCRYYKSKENPSLLLTYWWETILVKALSNCIKPQYIFYKLYKKVSGGTKYKQAPLVFKEYSKNAKGVDYANKLLSNYRNIHRTSHWWHVIFSHFLMVTLNNAYNIYKYNKDKVKYKTFAYLERKEFIFQIIRQLLLSNRIPNIRDMDFHISNNKKKDFISTGKVLLHLPEIVKGYEEFNNNGHKAFYKKRLDCNLCLDKRTHFCCRDCDNGFNDIKLCIECFEIYHKDLFSKIEEKDKNKNRQNWKVRTNTTNTNDIFSNPTNIINNYTYNDININKLNAIIDKDFNTPNSTRNKIPLEHPIINQNKCIPLIPGEALKPNPNINNNEAIENQLQRQLANSWVNKTFSISSSCITYEITK